MCFSIRHIAFENESGGFVEFEIDKKDDVIVTVKNRSDVESYIVMPRQELKNLCEKVIKTLESEQA